MNSSGKRTHQTDIWSGSEPFDELPCLAPIGGVPAISWAFGDDLLEEIDSLLDDQDVLVSFWQAPGQ
ncbi:MAG: hypothetical protein QOD57_5678 [Actinomycetota bacterium]|nr:hypothetical protein [Actinomycetota bacterium]MDQ1507951.1 hypothetical protein [Actinomycetota bacterium]